MIQFLPVLGALIDKFIPDPAQQAQAKIKMIEMEQAGELKELDASLQRDVAQVALNKIEAGSDNIFKSGWRPFIGWTCGVGFVYAVLIYPILSWISIVYGITPPPNLDTSVLMSVMLGMLGLGGMRSFEKFKGITK